MELTHNSLHASEQLLTQDPATIGTLEFLIIVLHHQNETYIRAGFFSVKAALKQHISRGEREFGYFARYSFI